MSNEEILDEFYQFLSILSIAQCHCTLQKHSARLGDLHGTITSSLPLSFTRTVRSCITLLANSIELFSISFCCANMQFHRHPKECCDCDRFEESTGNLRRHAKKCEPHTTSSSQQITAYASGSTYSAAHFQYLLAMWCARRHRPFKIVQDDELVKIFKMLYA